MSISIWSTHLNKQIIVKGSIDEWVDANMEAEEEIAKLKAELELWKRSNRALRDQTLEDGKELDKLRSSLDAIKRLLDSGFVPQ